MNFRLRQLRKAQGVTQSELADKIGVNTKTIGSWERGSTVPNAEQLLKCSHVFNCSPNDIMGWYETHPCETALGDSFEKELVSCYRESTAQRKVAILQTARDAAGMSKETAESAIPEPAAKEAV